ncbi:MAG: hypothetical protein QG635_1406, partial [Bacteroidota bacterium]|nr:hypothetical protein [Bacteroidota bacterium]
LTKDDFANELIPNIQFENIPTELENASKILISSKGNLWTITPEGLFFCRLSSNRWSYWKYPKYDPRNFVNEIIKTADDSYWIATDGGLLIKYANGSEKLIDKIENYTLRGLTGLACDDSGRIWISSGGVFGGAFCLENGKWRRYGSKEGLTDAPIHKIRIDSQHNLWFLTLSLETLSMGNGAFELKNGKFYRYDKSTGIISDRVYDFTEGAEGDLWFATNEGLSRFKNNQWKHWTINNGLRTSRVYTIVQDKQNRLWFSDGYSGVCYVDNDEIKFDSTLDSANVMQVTNLKFDDSGRLWIASKSGLFCYNKGVLSKFDKNRGLSAKYVWPIFFDKNRILAGTNGGGINVLYFDELDEPLPKVFFNQVLNKSGAHIISWKAFSFWGQIPPEDIEVRYRLDGGKWSSWSINRSITYYDLDPGNHIFEIEAKGLFGNINKIPIQLKFEVEEPIYLKPVFLIPIISLLALFIIFGLNYFEKKRKFVKELKKSQSNLSALIENTSDQIILLDSDFKIAHANSRFFAEYEKYHSYKPEIGDRLSEINDNREADFWSIIQTDAFNGKNFHSEHILNYQDKPYYYEVMAYPISVGDEFAGITIYMKNITYYKETEEKIKNSLVEKELLIKEINSRVKNNMQYILFLIDLQISGIKDDDIRRHLRKTQARILALSLIFDKLYQNENLTKIDMNEYCQRITQAQLEKFIMHGSSIDFNLIANKILLPIETAISCGLIINELFTNSLQYAFPPGFDAKVDLEIKAADNSKYQIFYKDNGVGLPKDINPYTSRSIGLFLINDISKHRLNGSIEISCERGTSFLITFNELGNRNN